MLLVSLFSSALETEVVRAGGTIYIRADGSIDQPSAPIQRVGNVYTLTENVSEGIVVERSNIIVEGAGCTIQGSGSGDGFMFSSVNDVTVRNITIKNFLYGFRLESSSRITLSDNLVNESKRGIGVNGSELAHFVHTIGDSNLIDGKPIYYLVGETARRITHETHPEVGFMALVNCENMSLEGLTLSNAGQGALLAYTDNSRIENNEIIGCNQGLWLKNSSNVTISRNRIMPPLTYYRYGIDLIQSSHNTISFNNVSGQVRIDTSCYTTLSENTIQWGLSLTCSRNTSVLGNAIYGFGLRLEDSHNSTISENRIVRARGNCLVLTATSGSNNISRNWISSLNGVAVIIDGEKKMTPYNIVSDNNITDSGAGILVISRYNIISGNNITNNREYGIKILNALYNVVTGNSIRNNTSGILLAGWNSMENEISGNIIESKGTCISVVGDTGSNLISGNCLANSTTALTLHTSDKNEVTFNTIVNNSHGINLYKSNYTTISGNTVRNNTSAGIKLLSSSQNIISGNTIADSFNGIWLEISSNNTFHGNNITDNLDGVGIHLSSNNTFYHNNFINNTRQAYIQTASSTNLWNHRRKSEGNYWSDYNGTDSNNDGLGDIPYTIAVNNTDNYPLMNVFSGVTPETPILVILLIILVVVVIAVLFAMTLYKRRTSARVKHTT